MNTVVFTTNTILDTKAITTFGINAKPSTNSPIGFFGTGLKYAIAVCLREGLDVSFLIDGIKHTFHTKQEEFRDKTFGFVYMTYPHRSIPFTSIDMSTELRLPFTTELGKTWNLWQAFRELYSNTLDEDGTCCIAEKRTAKEFRLARGKTEISITGEAFVNEFHDLDKNFHPKASRHRVDAAVEYFYEGSNHVYYRGMRVADLEKPSVLTYNILAPIDLTEDRTAKYMFQLEGRIRDCITGSSDRELIKSVMEAGEGTYESRFNYSDSYNVPSDTFTAYARSVPPRNTTVAGYLKVYDPVTREEHAAETVVEKFLAALKADEWTVLVGLLQDDKDEIIDLIERGEFRV